MKSFFGRYIRYKLFLHKSVIAINTFLCLLLLPSLAGTLTYAQSEVINIMGNEALSMDMFNWGAGSVLILAVIVAVIAMLIITQIVLILPPLLCKYNNSLPFADTALAMPLTHKQRYFGDFLTGLIIGIAPFGLSAVIALPFAFVMENTAKLYTDKMPVIWQFFSNAPSFFIQLSIILLLFFLGIYTVSCFMNAACGKFSATVIYSIIAMVIFTAFVLINTAFITENAKGMIDSGYIIKTAFSFTVPIGSFITSIVSLIENFVYDSSANTVVEIPQLIVTLAIYGLLFFAGYRMTIKRKSEKTGKTFVIDIVYHVISLITISTILLFGPYSGNSTFFIGVVILAALAYMFFELSFRLGFEKFRLTVIRFVCAIVGTVILYFVFVPVSEAIGAYQPDINNIVSVELKGKSFEAKVSSITFTEKEQIKQLYAIQKEVHNSPETETGNDIVFTYTSNDGSVESRGYALHGYSYRIWEKIKNIDGYDETTFSLDDYLLTEMKMYSVDKLPYLYYVDYQYKEDIVYALKADSQLDSEITGGGYFRFGKTGSDGYEDIKIYNVELKKGGELEKLLNSDKAKAIPLTDYIINNDSEPVVFEVTGYFDDKGEYFSLYVREADLQRPEIKQLMSYLKYKPYNYTGDGYNVNFCYEESFEVRCIAENDNKEELDALIKKIIAQDENYNDNEKEEEYVC